MDILLIKSHALEFILDMTKNKESVGKYNLINDIKIFSLLFEILKIHELHKIVCNLIILIY